MSDPCDPNWLDVVLLLECDGVNGSDVFTDLSPVGNTVTASSGAVVSTTNPKFGTGCLRAQTFRNVNVSIDSSAPLNLPPGGDFTIECWVRFDDASLVEGVWEYGSYIAGHGLRLLNNAGVMSLEASFFLGNGVTGWGDLSNTVPVVSNTWYHVAVVRHGTAGQLYVNGVGGPGSGSSLWSGSANFSGLVRFGRHGASGFDPLVGAIDEIRVTRGVAKYTANFTSPIAAFPTVACALTAVVPDVVGDDEATAAAEIEYVGLAVGTITTASSPTIPAGEVLSSDPVAGTVVELGSSVDLVVSSGPSVCSGVPFEGYISWPYLDFGLLGVDKMMEGFDVVAAGEFSVSFGYSQRDFSLATPAYTLDGDTLVGGMVPMPLTAPSFQLRLTFSGSQQWEWQASNLYLNDLGIG